MHNHKIKTKHFSKKNIKKSQKIISILVVFLLIFSIGSSISAIDVNKSNTIEINYESNDESEFEDDTSVLSDSQSEIIKNNAIKSSQAKSSGILENLLRVLVEKFPGLANIPFIARLLDQDDTGDDDTGDDDTGDDDAW